MKKAKRFRNQFNARAIVLESPSLNRCTMATVLGRKVEIPVCNRKLETKSLA